MTSLRLEFGKLLRKWRTYIGPIAMLLLIIAMLLGMKHGNEFNYMRHRLEQDFIVVGSFVNAGFMLRYLLEGVMFTFLPLFACLVCGDVVASEHADGTIRMMLVRPVSRLNVIISKYVVAVLYVLALVFGTLAVGYLLGSLYLGRGSLVSLSGGIWILPEREAVIRLLAAYGLAAAAMVAVGSIAFAISTFLSNLNGAIASAMGVLYGSAILGEIEYFAFLKPYLLTTHLEPWRRFFQGVLDVNVLMHSVGVMLIYSAAALIIGLVIFQRRDVLA